ncbi:MAG: SDR family NAD(P)-dependent oxidoreductase [Solirubrobacteraceae bacterium]
MSSSSEQQGPGGSRSRVWFVTGASSGIGRELALAALRQGDLVAAAARNPQALEELGGQFQGSLLVLRLDVRDEREVREAVGRVVAVFGRIDVVANNAGYGVFGAIEEATDEQARAIFDTNVFGVLNVLRATLPVLRAQRSGHILQGSSDYGQSARAGVGLLAATKYAVEGLSDALADEVRPLGIGVTLLEPGPMATSFGAHGQLSEAIDDYDETVRPARASGAASNGQLDPAAAALAILSVVDGDEEPPLRLAIGSAAAQDIRAALTARLADLDAWSAVTRSVDD